MKRVEHRGDAVAPDGSLLVLCRHDRDYDACAVAGAAWAAPATSIHRFSVRVWKRVRSEQHAHPFDEPGRHERVSAQQEAVVSGRSSPPCSSLHTPASTTSDRLMERVVGSVDEGGSWRW